jgi:hypothetical protein
VPCFSPVLIAASPYHGYVADAVTAVSSKRQLVGDGWRLRAERIEMLNDNGWRALVGVRRGLKLLVTWSDQDKELELEAWAGEPEETDGVAVIDLGDGDVWLARVPLCSCGDRGCGNVGIQLFKWLAGNELPALVDLLRDLPWTETIPTRTNVLQGDGLAAIQGPDTDYSASGYSYLCAPGTGGVFPLHQKHGSNTDDL